MPITRFRLAVMLLTNAVSISSAVAASTQYFAIEAIDADTGRGVPMVELQTTSSARYYTDSNGLVAFYEPGLMNQKVFFSVASNGYDFPPDQFGVRGITLETKPDSVAQIKLNRINIAQRLYRITGQGIYRDTILLGRKPPIEQPLLNAQVTGQDGILNAFYNNKLFWFYGDTNKLSYALGNFSMSGATTDPPEKIDPEKGINLHYFTDQEGFVKPMAPMKGEGVVWLYGVVVLPDESGHNRLLAFYQRREGLGPILENGFVIYDDKTDQFEKLNTLPPDETNPQARIPKAGGSAAGPTDFTPQLIYPTGYPSRVKENGLDYIYFTTPYPVLRVRADYKSYLDPKSYEAYTCLKPGQRFVDVASTQLDRDANGKLIWAWKKDTQPLNPKDQQDLINAGKMKRDESPLRLTNIDDNKPIQLNNCSCFWNDYRKKYIMIASESVGATTLGEVYFAESANPQGPWTAAKKIITHANKKNDAHDFYNPTQHPFLDRDNGKTIYLEGSYVNTFSGNPQPTPYYEYNQIMYKLDLTDPRLRFNHP